MKNKDYLIHLLDELKLKLEKNYGDDGEFDEDFEVITQFVFDNL